MYFVIPSCVPATGFDESGAVLSADDIEAVSYTHLDVYKRQVL